jgi:Tol biopolymer transport system component
MTRNRCAGTVADKKEMFFTVADSGSSKMQLMTSKLTSIGWSIPNVANFSNSGDDIHPTFSPNGNRLYYSSIRPLEPGGINTEDLNIWYVERKGDGWSDPINAGPGINSEMHETSPAFSQDGTMFFDVNVNNNKENYDWDIYKSKYKNGSFQKREKVLILASSEYTEFGPYIAPDDSYILFYSNGPDSYGEADLYVCFRGQNNELQTPVNLGEKVNSKFYDWSPFISPDGKFLIFSSYRNTKPIESIYDDYYDILKINLGLPKTGFGTFYWIDAAIIENLRMKTDTNKK